MLLIHWNADGSWKSITHQTYKLTLDNNRGWSRAFSEIVWGAECVFSGVIQGQIHDDQNTLNWILWGICMPNLELVRVFNRLAWLEPGARGCWGLEQLNFQSVKKFSKNDIKQFENRKKKHAILNPPLRCENIINTCFAIIDTATH